MSQIISFLLSLLLIFQACPFGDSIGVEYLTMLNNLSSENLRFTGTVSVTYEDWNLDLDVSGENSKNSSNFKVEIPDENIKLSVIRNESGVFAEKDAFIDFLAAASIQVQADEAYQSAFEKMHDKVSPEYVRLSDVDTVNSDEQTNTLRTIFKDFNNTLVTKNEDNEYVLEFSSDNSKEILSSLSEYVKSHKDTFIDFINKYEINIFDGDVSAGIDEYINDLNEIIADDTFSPKIIQTIKETLNGYKMTFTIEIGDTLSISGNFSFGKINDVSPMSVSNSIELSDFENALYQLYIKEYNANKAVIVWDNDNGYASVRYLNEEKNYTTMSNAEMLYNGDGKIYVPLRKTADIFNETVGWNAEGGYAYITKDGWECRMDGIVIDGSTYCHVREFEKIGYKVTYDSFDSDGNTRHVIMIYK